MITSQASAQPGDYRKTVEDAIAKVRAEGVGNIETGEGAHQFTQRLAEILACQDPLWGRKSTNGGPISHDTVAYRLGPLTDDGRNTRMRVLDYCIACGEPGAAFGWIDHGVITDQRFRPITPTNCGDTPDPDPDPGPEPTPQPIPTEPIVKYLAMVVHFQTVQIKALEDQTAELKKAVEDLKAEIAKGIKIRW